MPEEPQQPENAAPKAEDLQKANLVAQAGAQAAAGAETPAQAKEDAREAMRDEAQKQGLNLSEEDINKISNMFVDRVIEQFEARGAFDPPPEPVTAPQPAAAQVQEQEQVAQQPAPVRGEEPPRKKSFAEKFLGE